MKHLHFIGIEGSGASAVAAVAKAHGYHVSGCDQNLTGEYSSIFDPQTVFVSHAVEHLAGVDMVVVSPAIEISDPNNTELKAAKSLNLEILTWQQFLGQYLVAEMFVIAVCGTHGKSTTTAMVAKVLADANLDPTVILGAKIGEWGRNYRVGKSKYLVVEADEYNNNFMAYSPNLTVVTNIDRDHLEFFKDFDHIKQAFVDFLVKTKEVIVANLADSNVADTVKWVMKNTGVKVMDSAKIEAEFDLKLPGEFNISNAKAAFQTGILLGIDPEQILKSLNNFSGIGRRFEEIGSLNGAKVISDFAHHPTEMEVSLKAAREKYPDQKIWLIFQPHLFSRTKLLFNEFAEVLKNAPIDGAILVDIFASRENDPGDISSKMLVDEVSMGNVEYIPTVEMALKNIEPALTPKDMVIFMGAGDIDSIGREYLKR